MSILSCFRGKLETMKVDAELVGDTATAPKDDLVLLTISANEERT